MFEVYTGPNCIWCVREKELLTRSGIEYKELDISQQSIREELQTIAPGVRTVPQIFNDGQRIGGYQELVKYLNP